MELNRGNSISGQKDFQIQGSWMPVTPVKPIIQRPQPIYANDQYNQLGHENWERSGGFSTGFPQENQAQRIVASFDSTNCFEPNRGVNNWEATLAGRNPVSGNNARGNQHACIDSMAGWNNIPFVDLLAQAAMGSTTTGVMAPSSPFDFGYSPQFGSSSPEPFYASSLPATQDLSLGSKTWTDRTFTPQMTQCELPIPSRQTYDLNVLPGTIADELPSSTIPQFAPITPDKRTNQENENNNEVATTRIEIIELHQEKTLSHADSSFPAVSTAVTANHTPEKGSDQIIDLNMTPQQKSRRKKHRPKVIKEGKPKRTRKPAVPKPDASKENPTGKRKYVRKKGLDKSSTTTTPPEVAGEISDPKPVETTRKSARRVLNLELDGQGKNENSVRKSANVNPESQEQQFCNEKVQSKATVQICQGMEVTVGNTGAGIAYDLGCSINKHLKDYISLPTRQAPSTPPPSNTNLLHEKLTANAQSENYEEIGQVTADDKLGSEQIILKSNEHLASSLNYSSCSTTASLVDRQATAKKRLGAHILDMEHTSTVNLSGGQFNDLHSYEAYQVEDFTNRISGMYFPEIFKKRRTEKGQTSTTSSTSSSVTTAKDVVQLVRERLQNCENARLLESKANSWIPPPQLQTNRTPTTEAEGVRVAMDREQAFKCMLALGHKERLTKKRSKGPTRVRDLASLMGIAESKLLPTLPAKQAVLKAQGAEVSHGPQNCIEALVAESHAFIRRKRSKKQNSLISSVSSSRNVVQMHQKNVLYTQHKVLSKPIGPPPGVIWKHVLSVDAITERFKHLDINLEGSLVSYQEYNALVPYNTRYQSQDALVPYRIRKQEQNALVIYGSDGTIVPFDGSFYTIKKRRPRPKVDLDEETSRVWRLLLENINNEGIDGTDEKNARWWEEERRVFRGRADSFIARMHLVQGDRRFSKWKGSVVDSVIGVFLTQNVSDHLSSSAFMSLAAHFPLKPKSNGQQFYEEGTSILVEEPELCMLDLEDTIKWKEKLPDNLVCDQSSMTLNDPEHNEEKEVVCSNESFGSSTGCLSSNDDSKSRLDSLRSDLDNFHEPITQQMYIGAACVIGDRTAMEDVISSQSSVDSSVAQTADRRPGQCSESNSEAQDPATGPKSSSFDGSTSFLELLQRAVAPKLIQGHNNESLEQSDKGKMDALNQPGEMGYEKQNQNLERLNDPESSLVASIMPSSDHHSTLAPNSRSQEVDCIECLEEESRSSEISDKKDENGMSDRSRFTVESSNKATFQAKLTVSVQELPKLIQDIVQPTKNFTTDTNETEQSRGRPVREPISDVTESTSAFNTEHKGTELNWKEHNNSSLKALNETAADTLRAKRKRVGKETNRDFDWDSLRKQAQANGIRERTANTMDTIDWEAVRCADVGEIANTIKERGMNNMLAERIKDFLNRLVREHGSLDLEWLRDVPPDKAKEYLLSVRGLGLKSVECVRLLTLHHLAFPVDTNVGRIAVRLGWVPLQPLPESLQLHLLELYPVLESIQKFLWPRLCKLDQRTLYELHYQMITFGKVFCTKSKPNCNACPMRGECRHFASAFASARLALPGPEEKSIVTATENRTAGHNPAIITNRLQLPPPQVNQHSVENNQLEANHSSEAKSGTNSNEPIIEEPATPEPECTQISESDIEDACFEDPDEIPTIKLNIEEFTQNLQDYMQKNMELQDGEMSRALVALTPEAASLPTTKLKNISRLRTEHQVYELPDSHPLLQGLDKREPDDPCSYLLAIWTPGETINSIQPPEGSCSSQEVGKLCSETTCFSCNSVREANSQTVRGTLLIPCRTAMRGSFPLNGTYFQVNEVFADHDSSLSPIDVPRAWLWNLPRRTVYFGTSIPTIFKGLTTEGIQYCFWRGFVCVRGFDQKTRAPRPLIARLHFPASKLKAKTNEE